MTTTPKDGGMAQDMSLRDWFATHASEADIATWQFGPACLQIRNTSDGRKYEVHAPMEFTREQARYRYADAMLQAQGEGK